MEPGPRHIPDSRRAGRDTPLLYEVRASRSEGGTEHDRDARDRSTTV